MSRPVVTLQGIISDIDLKVDYLMCCYFFSQYSQTVYYPGEVTSLGKCIQMYGDRPNTIRSEVENTLRSFLKQWFTTATVDVVLEDNGNNPGIKLVVNAIVSDGDNVSLGSRSVGYSLSIRDSTFTEAINIATGIVLRPN